MRDDHSDSTPAVDSTPLARIATSLERVLEGFRAEAADRRRERRAFIAVLAIGFVGLLGVQSLLVSKSYRNASKIHELAVAIEAQGDDIRETREAMSTIETGIAAVKEEAAAAPRVEVAQPTKRGEAPKAKLVIPARPATTARDATTSSPAATAAPASPAVEIPLQLPPTSVGGGP